MKSLRISCQLFLYHTTKERTPGTFSRKDGRFGNIVYNPQQVRKG